MKRSTLAWLIGLGGIALVTAVCYALGDHVDRPSPALLLLVPFVAAGGLEGWRRSLVVSFIAGVMYGVAFLPPIGRFPLGLTVVIGLLAGRRERRRESDDVVRAVSHDLRTPLSTIRAASADLLTRVHTDSRNGPSCWAWWSGRASASIASSATSSASAARAGALAALPHTSAQRLERVGAPPIAIEPEPELPDVPVDEIQLDR